MDENDKLLSISCHCKINKYSFKIPASHLPIKQRLCHSDVSRRTSGCLFTSYLPLPLSNPPPDLDGLTKYKLSGILNTYFCSTCSATLYLEYNDDGHFEVSHGSIEGKTDGILVFDEHIGIKDTNDGGASIWITSFFGKPVTRWLGMPDKSPQIPLDWRADNVLAATPSKDEKLRVHCHCNGVDFQVQRPTEESLKASSPLPDLLVPYSSGQSAENLEHKPWWLSTDRNKYLAGTCACESCRRITGFDITPWTFIPVANLSLIGGEAFKLPFGTLKSYESTSSKAQKGRLRWFCSRCGANVFFFAEERPTLFDVSVGLLDAASGARAEEWLQWDTTDRVSFREDAHNVHLVTALEDGLIEWSKKEQGTGNVS